MQPLTLILFHVEHKRRAAGRSPVNAGKGGRNPAMKGSERMNVTTYFKKHGFIFGLDIDTNPITVKIFSDMETAVNWNKTGKILCSKSIAVLYSNRTAINQLINSVKTQTAFNNK